MRANEHPRYPRTKQYSTIRNSQSRLVACKIMDSLNRRSFLQLTGSGLVLGAMAPVLAGCGGSSGSGSKGNADAASLEFPNFQGSEAPFSTWWGEFIKAYEKQYPSVHVKTSDVHQSNSYADLLQTRLSAKNPPDVIQMTVTNFARLAAPGWLMPLDSLIADTKVPTKWGKLQQTYVWEGKTLGVMTLAGGDVMYYNQKLLKDANQAVPTTPDELLAAANAVHDPGKGRYGFIGVSAPQDGKLYSESCQFVYGMGGAWAKNDDFTFTAPETIQGLELYRNAMKTSPRGLTENTRNELFYAGRAAFMFEGNYFDAGIKQKASKAIAPDLRPARPAVPHPAGSTSVFLSIPLGLSAARQKNAENFVKLAISPEWQQRYAELVGVPAPDPDSIKNLASKNPDLTLFADLASTAVNYVPTGQKVVKDTAQWRKMLFDHLVAITTSNTSIESEMQKMQASAEALIK